MVKYLGMMLALLKYSLITLALPIAMLFPTENVPATASIETEYYASGINADGEIILSEFCEEGVPPEDAISKEASSEDAVSEDTAGRSSNEALIDIREDQWNVFNVPVDTSGVIWDFHYDTEDPFNKVRVAYRTIPAPFTSAEFSDIDSLARSLLGIRYSPGGKSPSTGFDCSGYVLYVLSHCGSKISSGSCEGQLDFCYVLDPEAGETVMPGDIVFFKGTQNRSTVSHVGIYLGDNKMIHAGTGGICIVDLGEPYWTNHFYCFGRPVG